MCGVVGVLAAPGSPPVDEGALGAALAALEHRGPDGVGSWVGRGGRLALGHRRLAVVGGAQGGQPVVSEDGRVRAVVNGEFYDHRRLRRELEARGHRFGGSSDAELLIHLYEERGTGCLESLRGEFAFVLWDDRRGQLFAGRDRFGVKPLCWGWREGALALASEAKALFALGWPVRWDHEAFLHAAHHQYLPPDRTLFQGVFQLPPGHVLVAGPGQKPRVERYWDMDLPQASERQREVSPGERRELVAGLRRELEEAVRLRVQGADVPVACALSGGLDSSAVAALTAKHAHLGAPTVFGIRFVLGQGGQAGYDEGEAACAVARHLGLEFEPVWVRQTDLLEELPAAVERAEGLAINGHLPAKFMLSRAIAQAGYKVVLTGEGADEALWGYPHLRQDLGLGAGGDASVRGVMVAEEGGGGDLAALEAALGVAPSFLVAKAQLGARVQQLLRPSWRQEIVARGGFGAMLEGVDVAGQLIGRHRVDQSVYLWSKLCLTGYILRTLGDGTEMAHGVEGRPPFLDHHLFALCRRLPRELLIDGQGVEKVALRQAVADLLPEATLTRPKHPLLAPPVCLLEGDDGVQVASLLQDVVRGRAFAAQPFFDEAAVRRLVDRLPGLPPEVRQRQEPALMMALTCGLLQERFSVGG